MAPRMSMAQRRKTESQNEHVYAPGRVGRKTGITIPDNGRRDEHGFEVIEDLFSSPDRELQAETNGRAMSPEDEDEQDMEIDDGSELGPATTRKLQQGRPSLPRARSPIKTNLNSPARQNPHLAPTPSPTRGSIVTARERSPRPEVARRLDFSKSSQDNTMYATSQTKLNGTANRGKKPAAARPRRVPSPSPEPPVVDDDPADQTEDEEEDEQLDLLDEGPVDGGDVEDQFPEEPQSEPEPEVEDEAPVVQELKSTNKSKPPGRRGRKPKAPIEKENDEPAEASSANTSIEENVEGEPVKKRKGRPKAVAKQKEPTPPADPTPPPKTSKRGRAARAAPEDADEDAAESRDAKRPKTSAKANKGEQSAPSKQPAPTKENSKPGKQGRKRKSSGVGVDSPIQQGPPLPKSRGLVTVRREDTATMRTTRSGRASFKPLEWWKGEHVEYDQDQENIFEDAGKRHFKMPTVKGVVRTEQSYEPASKRRGRAPAGRRPGRRPSAVVEEDEVEREDWEYDPGRVVGQVVTWKPEHEFEPPEEDELDFKPEELAISENAIQLRDIKDATFKFAKTLTLPFFGSGIVDLPAGAEKRPRNARKNHSVFFVHTGNVRVTIEETEFGIAKGGMFFVPRGNRYLIRNETDRPARIFFAQGCEIFVGPGAEDEEGHPSE